jgi:HlyD family secretion protein
MQVDTNVSEGDVGRLTPGMKATFTVDAFPGQRFKGTIETIRNAATTVQNVVTYDAVIKVANDDLKLRPGMTANVTIVYAEKDDAIAVPAAALRFRPPNAPAASASGRGGGGGGGGRGAKKDDAPIVETRPLWLLQGNSVTALQVKIGMSDGAYTEVTPVDGSSLDPGTQVAIDATGPGVSSAPAATTAAPGGAGGGGGMRRIF